MEIDNCTEHKTNWYETWHTLKHRLYFKVMSRSASLSDTTKADWVHRIDTTLPHSIDF